MNEWVSVGGTAAKKPRKRPVAKRRPVPLPRDATQVEELAYTFLAKSYPEPRSSEDVLADLVKQGHVDVTIEDVWSMLDVGVLSAIRVEVRPGRMYVLKAE